MIFKVILALSLLLISSVSFGKTSPQQAEPIRVVTLGTFHFNFPNLDVVKVKDDSKIDVLSNKYQRQLEVIAQQLKAFNPTHIVVEHKAEKQKELSDSYKNYLSNTTTQPNQLPRSEVYQFGFRLAEKLGHKTLFAVDTWGKMYPQVDKVLNDEVKVAEFGKYYKNNPDNALRYDTGDPVYKLQSITAELLRINNEEHIKKSLGNYLIGHFKFENEENEYFGADFETGRWFNRNLRIFRNIQRVPTQPGDRILVIFGSGHMNLLNLFFDASPEYKREPLDKYLNTPE